MSPMLAKRPCRRPGCNQLVERGTPFCPAHQKVERKRYDADRGTAKERGYGSDWKRFRAWILKKRPICEVCKEQPSSTVHHDTPIEVDPSLKLRADNVIACCRDCHERVERDRGHRWGGRD